MTRTIAFVLVTIALLGSTLGCCCLIPTNVPNVEIPDIEIPGVQIPTVEVGERQEMAETVPLAGLESATVELKFGAGTLELMAGAEDELFSGSFAYNVADWRPEIKLEGDALSIRQGGVSGEDWENLGIPTGDLDDVVNNWDLAFSPAIPLEMDIEMGAVDGALDFTGLQLGELDLSMGAGDLEVAFDAPNAVEMSRLRLESGAAQLDVLNIGNANTDNVIIRGGAGDINLNFGGDWTRSASVDVATGVGDVTLELPANVGVRVESEGLVNVNATGFEKEGDAYVNDAWGEAEIELDVQVTTAIGNVNLVEVSE